MASKLDTIIDRLEQLTIELDQLKRRAVPLLPIPKPVKAAFASEGGRFEDAYREFYFDTVRAAADIVVPSVRTEDIQRSIGNEPLLARELAPKPKKKRSAKAKASDKKLSKAFKMANAAGRTSKGKLRKGETQGSIARRAQRLRKKMK
tara:strand:- start:111 stop:554 length:444 start_codon:yes stop_codon:yes gene_type:complete